MTAQRGLRVLHLTTVDMSLELLLRTELAVDVEAGFDVLAASAPGPYVPAVETLGVRHIPLPALSRSWNPRRDLTAAKQLWKVVQEVEPDVLHTHNPKTGVVGRIVGRAARVPVVVNTCHGLWYREDSPRLVKTAVIVAEAFAAQFSHFELYQNDADRRTLSRFVRSTRARTVGNGVDLSRFQRRAEDRKRVRAELGVSDDEVLVGGVGRLVREKGIYEFIEAASRLSDRATFVWVGGVDESKPDRVTPEAGPVRFIGERSDMPALYSAFDVFALPTYREGFSRSAMEAAACGCAIVLTDIRGCRELGEDRVHIRLVAPRDAADLAEAIAELIGDAPLRASLGAAASERAKQEFDQRRVALTSIDTYAQVAERRRPAIAPGLRAAAERATRLGQSRHDRSG